MSTNKKNKPSVKLRNAKRQADRIARTMVSRKIANNKINKGTKK